MFAASMIPQVLPFSSRLFTAYFTRFGVTIPSTISGKAKTSIALRNAAAIRYPFVTTRESPRATPEIINFPKSGMSIVQVAAAKSQINSLSGFLWRSAIRPPRTFPIAMAIIIVPIIIVQTI